MEVGTVASGDAIVSAAPMELEVEPSKACQMEVGTVASGDAAVSAVPMELEPIEQMEDLREVQWVATSSNRNIGGGGGRWGVSTRL
jgi:hypothetical protein